MSTRLTKLQKDALDVLTARLDVNDPGFRGSDEVRSALSGPARIYIDSGVLPLLTVCLSGRQYCGQDHHIAQDAASVRIARERSRQ